MDKYTLCVSPSTLQNHAPSEMYQTYNSHFIRRPAVVRFNYGSYEQHNGRYQWKERLYYALYDFPPRACTHDPYEFRFELLCERWCGYSEMQIDLPYFGGLLLSVFAILLKSSFTILGRLQFYFHIAFRIFCIDCSPLIFNLYPEYFGGLSLILAN